MGQIPVTFFWMVELADCWKLWNVDCYCQVPRNQSVRNNCQIGFKFLSGSRFILCVLPPSILLFLINDVIKKKIVFWNYNWSLPIFIYKWLWSHIYDMICTGYITVFTHTHTFDSLYVTCHGLLILYVLEMLLLDYTSFYH